MKNKEKIIKFLKLKNEFLKRKGKRNFLFKKDIDVIKKWDEDDCRLIFDFLQDDIKNGAYGHSSHTCPFCMYNFHSCRTCSYGKNHGICVDTYSDYQSYKDIAISNKNYLVMLNLV